MLVEGPPGVGKAFALKEWVKDESENRISIYICLKDEINDYEKSNPLIATTTSTATTTNATTSEISSSFPSSSSTSASYSSSSYSHPTDEIIETDEDEDRKKYPFKWRWLYALFCTLGFPESGKKE